jgi:hypothetical protein
MHFTTNLVILIPFLSTRTEFSSKLQKDAMKYRVIIIAKLAKQGGFRMFWGSFVSLSQSFCRFPPLSYFLIFLFLGAYEPSDGVASRGVFRAQSTANLGQISANLGRNPP